ncbi:MAG: Wzz/FepE/Etk N-terminal domain-containing protein, partial [Xanthobacteraceae bacterium]
MLQRTGSSRTIHDGEAYEQGGQQRIDLVEIIAFLKSSRRAIGGWAIFAVTLALVYSFTTAPEYTAIASLILDTRKIQLFKSDSVVGDNAMDAGQVESQVEVLRSENIAIAVIRDLRLTQDPEFVNPQPGLLLTVIRALFSINDDGRAKSEFEKERSAVNVFRGNLTVRRIGLTYVLEISYRSLDPEKAARVAN